MNHFLPYKVTAIDEPSLLPHLKEINESSESRAKCLKILRKELQNLPDIEPCLEEQFLLRFLRVSKFDTSKALQRIQKYYQQQEIILEALKDLSLPLEKARSVNHLWTSPYRLKNNTLLLIALAGKVDYGKVTFAERFYLDILAADSIIENPIPQIVGITAILDLKGYNFRSLLAFTPSWLLLFVETFLNAFPARIKAIHFVNSPAIFGVAFKIFYPFLSKKIQERLFMHSDDNWKSLHAEIPPDVLPEEYGGKLKMESCINCLENIEELEDHYHEVFHYGYIKTKTNRMSFRPISQKK